MKEAFQYPSKAQLYFPLTPWVMDEEERCPLETSSPGIAQGNWGTWVGTWTQPLRGWMATDTRLNQEWGISHLGENMLPPHPSGREGTSKDQRCKAPSSGPSKTKLTKPYLIVWQKTLIKYTSFYSHPQVGRETHSRIIFVCFGLVFVFFTGV